jgi:NADH:ubiquinone oxidoreductase subunit C
MDITETLQAAELMLAPWDGVVSHPSPERLDKVIPQESLKPVVKALVEARWGYLAAITGLDHLDPNSAVPTDPGPQLISYKAGPGANQIQREGTLEVLYHFCRGACILTLRVSMPYSSPVLSSICDLVPTATLFERELMEMFGIKLLGTPNTDKLLLPDDWPDGVFPLRKSFQGFKNEAVEAQEAE